MALDLYLLTNFFSCIGLLLRDIKEFWRGALVLSLLLYPEDIHLSKDLSSEDTELNERKVLFNRIENAILEMGNSIISYNMLIFMLEYCLHSSHLKEMTWL